jgi:choline dehydrogenase
MSEETFDYVVVGAGSAGSVLAVRLSEDPAMRVALVEAGEADASENFRIPLMALRLIGSSSDWGYSTVEQFRLAGRKIYWPRGKVLGGSSSVNFQMWIPGHSFDYEPWVRAAGALWSWEAVEPYYRRAERWAGGPQDGETYGREGPLWLSPPRDPDPTTASFLEACTEVGLKQITGGLGGQDNTGCAITPLNQLRGTRWSTADGYLRPALGRANLRVITGEQVHRVLLEDGRAIGVELADGRLKARREVILSAGAIGSPQLLMLSGVGEADDLRSVGIEPRVQLPGVGRNLHDHVALDVIMKAIGPVRLMNADIPANRQRYEEERCGPLTSNVAEAVAFFRSDGGSGAPNLEVIWAPIALTDDAPNGAPGFTVTVILLQPESRGRITLADADPTSAPRIDPAYLTVESDLRTFITGLRFAEQLFDTDALHPLIDGPLAPWPGSVSDDALVRTIQDHAQTLFHPVGTCRMGQIDDNAVVDPRLRVRGIEGLRVVDASVIPRITRGHTHAPSVMIGERAADLIREDARQ